MSFVWMDMKLEPLDARGAPVREPLDVKQGKDIEGGLMVQATYALNEGESFPCYCRLIVNGKDLSVSRCYEPDALPPRASKGDSVTLEMPVRISGLRS